MKNECFTSDDSSLQQIHWPVKRQYTAFSHRRVDYVLFNLKTSIKSTSKDFKSLYCFVEQNLNWLAEQFFREPVGGALTRSYQIHLTVNLVLYINSSQFLCFNFSPFVYLFFFIASIGPHKSVSWIRFLCICCPRILLTFFSIRQLYEACF